MIDEERNVHLADAAAILSANFHCVRSGDDIFASISPDMVIDTGFQRLEESRFSVITAAYDKGDPPGNAHPLYYFTAGKG